MTVQLGESYISVAVGGGRLKGEVTALSGLCKTSENGVPNTLVECFEVHPTSRRKIVCSEQYPRPPPPPAPSPHIPAAVNAVPHALTRILPKRLVNATEQTLPSGIKASSAITYSRSTSSCGPREDSAVRPPLLPAL